MFRQTLSLGFVGGGWNSAVGTTHFVAARLDGLFTVDAGAFSRDPEINRQTASRWDVAEGRTYGSAETMLQEEAGKLDAIVVLTPTPDHVAPVLAALDRGVPVICEKALAATADDAIEISRAVASSDGFLAVTFNYTGYPMVRELRRMARDGRLGELTQVHVEMPQEGFARLDAQGRPMTPQSWRLHDGPLPTISLDLGVHLHNLIKFVTGETLLEVVAVQGSHGNFPGIVDNVMCLARHSGGLAGSYWFSKSAIGHRNGLRIRLYGRKGSAEWNQLDPEILVVHDEHGDRTSVDRGSVLSQVANEARYTRFKVGHPAGFIEAFGNLYDDIGECLLARREGRRVASDFVFGAGDAVEGLLALEAMAESSRTGAWTAVPPPPGPRP